MFKNRTMQVKFTKDADAQPGESTDTNFETKTIIIADAIENVINKIAKAALCYVVLDTGRRVLIARANRK